MEVVYQSSPIDTTAPLLVLDASFNPPHRAHYAIVAFAAAQLAKTSNHDSPQDLNHAKDTDTTTSINVLLSYSASNADKGTASNHDQLIRSDMIELFAKHFFSNDNDEYTNNRKIHWITAIAKSSYPKFVDKCKSIVEWSHKLPGMDTGNTDSLISNNIIFLMGFDTLVRLLDPKYYKTDQSLGSDIVNQLNIFFKHAKVFVLPRGEEEPEKLVHSYFSLQNENSSNATHTKAANFPAWWEKRIQILHPDLIMNQLPPVMKSNLDGNLPLNKVSSTTARNMAKNQNYNALLDIVKSQKVAEYIKHNSIY